MAPQADAAYEVDLDLRRAPELATPRSGIEAVKVDRNDVPWLGEDPLALYPVAREDEVQVAVSFERCTTCVHRAGDAALAEHPVER